MRFASLKYDESINLGDEIQTLAAEQHLPGVDARIDRDSMASFRADEAHIVILQGWFGMNTDRSFPPSLSIVPIFVGFHIADRPASRQHMLSGSRLAYLKEHEPIGCRDSGTQHLLESVGVRAYTTHCLTLTFPKRSGDPHPGKVFIVDGQGLRIPRPLRKDSVRVSQETSAIFGEDLKRAMAQRLLDVYREQARLVITTRLHCALPCLAIGIPVIFFGDPDDYRLGVLTDLGVPIIRRHPRSRLVDRFFGFRIVRRIWRLWNDRRVDWNPAAPDLEQKKNVVRNIVLRERQRAEMVALGLERPFQPTQREAEGV